MSSKSIILIGFAFVSMFSALALAADAPGKIELKYLENLYEPSVFDHELHEGAADSCKTCHHKPAGQNVKCITCHKVPFDKDNLAVIGLKGAFHEQCMKCHKENGVKNGCLDCHAKKQ